MKINGTGVTVVKTLKIGTQDSNVLKLLICGCSI